MFVTVVVFEVKQQQPGLYVYSNRTNSSGINENNEGVDCG